MKKKIKESSDKDSKAENGYLVCAKEGLELPKNLPQLLEKINDPLAHKAGDTVRIDSDKLRGPITHRCQE